jgi:predicted secreted protein
MPLRRPILIRPLAWLLLAVAGPLCAQTPAPQSAPPQNLVSLTASATTEVAKDQMTVVFSLSKEGADAGAVQAQLKQALDAALNEARKVTKPVQLEVQTGNFSLMPRYSPKGGITGWIGSAELMVEGRDMPGIAQLTGRINTMTINRVSFALSREAREKVESEVTAQAIARYRVKADQISRQFGFGSYVVREVQVSSNDAAPGGYQPMLRSQMAKVGDESLPTEAGKASVTATVSGSVQMQK